MDSRANTFWHFLWSLSNTELPYSANLKFLSLRKLPISINPNFDLSRTNNVVMALCRNPLTTFEFDEEDNVMWLPEYIHLLRSVVNPPRWRWNCYSTSLNDVEHSLDLGSELGLLYHPFGTDGSQSGYRQQLCCFSTVLLDPLLSDLAELNIDVLLATHLEHDLKRRNASWCSRQLWKLYVSLHWTIQSLTKGSKKRKSCF